MTRLLVASFRKLTSSRTIWALGDQGMVSLGNFSVNIILARSVPIADFGIYALTFGVFLFLNGLHGSFVNYPLAIRLVKDGSQGVSRLVGLALMLTAILVLPLCIGVVVLFYLVDRPHLIPFALFAFAAWRFQDVMRRALMAQLKYRETVPGDAISYLGQAILMVGLGYFELLTLEAVFLAMGATSAAAALVQAMQVGVRFSRPAALLPFVKECWHLGRWTVLRVLTSVGQAQGVGWILAAVHGVEATAHFRAAVNVLAVSHPIMSGIGNLILPSVAHAHRESMSQVLRVTAVLGLQGAALVFPYFIVLASVPTIALAVLYGPSSPYRELHDVLVILSVSYMISYASRMLTGTLNGLARPDLSFRAQFCGTLAAILISFPLAAWGGVLYAAIGSMFAHATLLSAAAVYLRREAIREGGGSIVPVTARNTQ